METGYDKELTEDEGLEMCESCAWAEWDSGDWSVGIGPCVEDCRAEIKGTKPRNKYEDFDHIPPHHCPWYSKQFPREKERLRCESCNSPKFEYIRDILRTTKEGYEIQEQEIVCNHCGEKRIIDVYDVMCIVNE